MTAPDPSRAAGLPRRLFCFNAGFLREPRLRRILTLAGHELRLGLPGASDGIVVWGRSPTAHRGEGLAARWNLPLVRVEDAFLRSIRPGRSGDAPLGLFIGRGVHFDPSAPSDLERLLAGDPLDDRHLLDRAQDGIARLRHLHLSKYNDCDPAVPAPPPGYVLLVDQTRGDAAVRCSGASEARFRGMLALAQDEHPGAPIVVKLHPESRLGLRPGHFGPADRSSRVSLCDGPVSPWHLLEGARAVYTVSSQLGFEAILAGHRPVVLGQPFYAGWGLTDDRAPPLRRGRRLTRAQLFAAAMILAPVWYDPCRDRLCRFEEAVDQLEAEVRAHREDRHGHVALGMRLWKRRRLSEVFGGERPLRFVRTAAGADASGRPVLVWGSPPVDLAAPMVRRVEDGFLRSRGLGAQLVPPLSLVADDLGIHYDPSRESRLERLILSGPPPGGRARADRLRRSLIQAGLGKYNLGGRLGALPEGHRILVPGQVEDDASIRLGTGEVRTNLALLRAVREANPEAVVVYKPHPDVEAGLRPGRIDARGLADAVAARADPVGLIDACHEVWTMTSLLGFEALIRGRPVTCLGTPFYAGWGLTRDLGPVPDRRLRSPEGGPLPRPSLEALIHAALIAYPRYFDPVARRACPPEVVVERLAQGALLPADRLSRLLAKLQGTTAGLRPLWYRGSR
ncbi:capsular polysaccharide biosynthesis protein [Rhodobacter sp. CZR27]|uniref:capsular polysaccharide biosynthesis protein n=1 Tax=Rhodobacter sp. CZR27 TaxID=2033869 RepID=UPI000BBE9A62|nr:capsular polysaccharide biosynthesis protein [Rhodobacter sp. CZR27]